jgi:bifunctional non-homologous end joining protein LigD
MEHTRTEGIAVGLAEYKRKRNFKNTPEPAGGGAGKRIFTVQLHHASHRHFDFRLEYEGVLKSWAVPKGPSFDPKVKRLAMQVEDHPVSYALFEGDIPQGNYGAGHVDVFDHGVWEPIGDAGEGLSKGELKFILHGDVLRGSWVLVRTRRQGSKQQWLLIKHQDEFAGPRDANDFVDPQTDRPIALAARKKTWKAVARKTAAIAPQAEETADYSLENLPKSATKAALKADAFEPELCRSQDTPPEGEGWLHEVKWDGYRIVATVVRGKVRLWSRNAIEWTQKLPELEAAIKTLGLTSAQLDGEMIVLRGGRDDFNALQGRLSAENAEPPVYMLFDLPYVNGKSLRKTSLIDRKAVLARLLADHPHPLLRYSEHHIGDGASVFAQATKGGLEGIVSKRIDSGYSGTRNGNWVKVKGRPSDEFVVIGFTEPKGSRSGIGALLLAQPRDGRLTYLGRVGTGFGNEQLRALRKQLTPAIIEETDVDIDLMERRDQQLAIWVKPQLVVEVFYQGVGGQGLLRQVAFKTIRTDKTPADLAETTKGKKVKTKAPAKKAAAKKAVAKKMAENKSRTRAVAAPAQVSGDDVVITHPEREVFPETGISKGDVADYYKSISRWLLPEVASRPLSVVRCPDGTGKACFFQKHVGRGWGEHVYGVEIEEKNGSDQYLCIRDEAGLIELVQMNVLEFHPWGAKSSDPDHADRIVFDLDPHPTVKWPRMRAAALEVRAQIESIGLKCFLRTSGGKGLHLVVPLSPPAPWDDVKAFALGVAQAMAVLHPEEFVAKAGESNRQGKIFVDYLRNGRGATSVASYSLRARAAAGVAMPLAWEELGRLKSGDAFTIKNAAKHIAKRTKDPWADIDKVQQPLPDLD